MTEASSADVQSLAAMLDLEHPVKAAATAWANAELPTPGSDATVEGVVTREIWRQAAHFGLLGMQLPRSHGGSDASAVEIALTFEGLGASEASNGVVFAIASQALTANRAMAASGSESQLDRWAGPLGSGELFASFAMSEPHAGSHPWDLETTAQEQPDGSWLLNGRKSWVTLGPLCDVAVVFAASDPDRGQWGISAFIVEAGTEGFEQSEAIDKMGLRACPFGEFEFRDCAVPADALLGKVGAGASIFSRTVEAERAFLYASQIGAMERLIGRSVDHARSRRQADVHIGSHQAVSHRIVDMKLHHEAARLLLYKAAARHDRGESVTLEAALTKLMASEHGVQASIDAMRTFGAAGYSNHGGIEVEVRDALGGLAYSGTPDVTRNIVASMLGLTRPI